MACNREITLGHHRIYIGGEVGRPVKHRSASNTSARNPSPDPSDVTEIWNVNPWYYHENSLANCVDNTTRKWFREFLVHGNVWTGVCENAVHQSQRLRVRPLKSSDWPRSLLGPSWPSFPSITEWLGMLRRGIDPFERPELKVPEGHSGYTRVSRGELRENPVLAARIVSNVIVGIRSSIEVPGKFLRFFRYSQNFLILTATYAIPIGLVRFLLGQWCVNPFSLWLRRQSTLKQYLRKVPISLVKRARLRLADFSPRLEPTRAGVCTFPADDDSEFYSEGSSELD